MIGSHLGYNFGLFIYKMKTSKARAIKVEWNMGMVDNDKIDT